MNLADGICDTGNIAAESHVEERDQVGVWIKIAEELAYHSLAQPKHCRSVRITRRHAYIEILTTLSTR